ncbi:MAG: CRISPR-associated endonuclease Cas3'', partial [Methanomassiliicoccales archaeon]
DKPSISSEMGIFRELKKSNKNDEILKKESPVTLVDHLTEVREQLKVSLSRLKGLSETEKKAIEMASILHDIGKAHPIFQKALGLNGWAGKDVWAKSGKQSVALKFERKGFRHELASLIILLANQNLIREAIRDEVVFDLTSYLVVSHHGRIRCSVRSTPFEALNSQGSMIRGVMEGDEIPSLDLSNLLGVNLPPTRVDFSCLEAKEDSRSWVDRVWGLVEGPGSIGPFRLGYLEAIVRISDWRASDMVPIVALGAY